MTLAAAQHGVVERGRLRALGLTDSAIGRRLDRGSLHRVHRGVYAVGHGALSMRGRWTAGVLACGPGAVLSHSSAAALWRLWPLRPGAVTVTVPGPGTRSVPGVLIYRARRLGADELATQYGIPARSPGPTILDRAATVSERTLEGLLDEAAVQGLTDRPTLEALARARRGHRGASALRRALARHAVGTTLTRSVLEERLLALCRAHGLPEPRLNQRVAGLEVDVLFAGHGLVVEADGWDGLPRRAAFERDRERDAVLARAGLRVLRFSTARSGSGRRPSR